MISIVDKKSLCVFSRIVLIILVFVLCLSSVDLRAADEGSKIQVLRQTGKQLLDVGYEQYRRGMYAEALSTLEKVSRYKKYLSVSDLSKLDSLLTQVGSAVSAQVDTEEILVEVPAESVIAAPEVEVVYSEPVVIEEYVVETVDLDGIYESSVSLFASGRYAEAKSGFEQLVEAGYQVSAPKWSASEYLEKIAQVLPAVDTEYIEFVPVDVESLTPVETTVYEEVAVGRVEGVEILPVEMDSYDAVGYETAEVVAQSPAVDAKENYIDVIRQKQRIQQSYTQAVVNDSIAQAKVYAEKEEFAKSAGEISQALGVVEKNKLLLGDEVYSDYVSRLNQLRDEISEKRLQVDTAKAEKSRAEAQAAQERLREQQAADRAKRIEDLMAHAVEYQEQQRYEDALGQVETLLAIDPMNKQASRTKTMLEDILNLRRQLDVKRRMGREEEDLLYENQESMIPHADLITYPRNWQDISAKRKPKKMKGLSEADEAVYRQLKTIVDLSALGPDTLLDEAIEIVRTSVEPPLKLTVRWRDLEENAYIEPDTLIGMQGIEGVPLGKGLTELLDSVSGGIVDIDYVVEDGIVTVATKASLPARLVTQAYDITELIGRPAAFQTEMELGDDISSGGSRSSGDGDIDSGAKLESANAIMMMVQETIEPDSWFVNGGEGTISINANTLIVLQTPEIHEQVYKLLMEDLRESLGQQVSIETRFLFVTENFLEDIGLDMTVSYAGSGKLGPMIFEQGSYEFTQPVSTGISGSLADTAVSTPSLDLVGGITYGSTLDDLSLSFLLRATQAHSDAKMLTAPRVTVLSSESAFISVLEETSYVSDYDFDNVSTSGSGDTIANRTIADPETDTVTGGVILNVTPTITADKKYVILQISTSYRKSNIDEFNVFSETGQPYPIGLPVEEVTTVRTRVSVPDGGTLLIGGQKLAAEINKEAGVPGLAKLPILGRLFTNRSKIKDQDILLILVKPTIILQEESEREYFAPLD